mmetsp:Transcript_1729/g.5222  ORF Transcript_1729/g.5222 Transcript_1729/m.5222 type:complete len:830 (+) Transcript_1729:24-2513(+)
MDVYEQIREAASAAKVPTVSDRVLKSECLFSFDTPLSDDGLFTSLSTFTSVGKDYLALHSEKTRSKLYLRTKVTRIRKAEDENGDNDGAPKAEATSGGVKLNNTADLYDDNVEHSIVCMPEGVSVPYPDDKLPEMVSLSASGIISAVDSNKIAEIGSAEWTETRPVSKYAENLPRVENDIKISPDPKSWKCQDSGMTENLWLNLSTGYIGSGRKNWDGTGGTGAALKHYEETGRQYPLCVKLGTITPQGADVFSYAPDENDMVEDPYLADHLARWGINMQKMEKTDKTMAEMEVELNESFEFKHILENDKTLQPITGPGLVGLENLGNSCYMNSVLQMLFTTAEFNSKYAQRAEHIFNTAPANAQDDLPTQMAKVGVGIAGDRYLDKSITDKDQEGIQLRPRPQMFKTLVGKNHPEFSTGRQQDAMDFFQYLMELLTRAERVAGDRLYSRGDKAENRSEDLFRFQIEERLEDNQSGNVKYTSRTENVLSLVIPTEAAENIEVVREYEEREKKRAKLKEEGELEIADEEEPVKLRIPFSACLNSFVAPREIADFTSPVTNEKGAATQIVRFKSFPQYLVVQMMRFTFAEDWTPKKLDVLVDVPERISLEKFRGSGLQEGETVMPESKGQESNAIVPDAAIVSQLMAMGFSENGSKRAAIATSNANAEVSMEWVLQHMNDPDFNDPIPTDIPAQQQDEVNAEHIQNLQSMGFSTKQAKAALVATTGDIERAADWLFSRMDDIDTAVAEVLREKEQPKTSENPDGKSDVNDGPGEYELAGIVSHIGKHTQVGHYVAHMKKDGKWVLFNDEKVAVSAKPPKDLGYLYLFKRVE